MMSYEGGPYSPWLKVRLESMFYNPPRFENSYYGPINGILNCIFPPTRNFLVKPQAILVPNHPTVSSSYLPPGITNQHPDTSRFSSRIAKTAANLAKAQGAASGSTSHRSKTSISSIDSLGDNILPRSEGGWIDGIFIPDFLVVKATEGTRNNDVALVLVEVKLNMVASHTSINQVEAYLNCLQTKNYSSKFVAFLSMGSHTRVWTTSGQGNNLVQRMSPGYVTTGSVEFCNLMEPVQTQHWW